MKKHELSTHVLAAQDIVMRWVRSRTNAQRLEWTHMVIMQGKRLASGSDVWLIKAGVRLSPERRHGARDFPLVNHEACDGYLDIRARVDFSIGEAGVPAALKVNCQGGHAVGWGCNGSIDSALAVFEHNVERVGV